jgi:uncharacterized membrane protein YidH (DUF202 family)
MQRLLLAMSLIATGSVVVALPDDGRRLVSISRNHGVSTVDSVGIALIVAGWALVVSGVWQRRRRVFRRLRRAGVAAGAGVVIAGLALIVWSVTGDHGAWWVAGVVLAVAPQLAAAIAASVGR